MANELTNDVGPTFHRVAQGDTLSAIAQRYNIPLATLISFNPSISNPNRISIGQTVNLQGPYVPPAPAPKPVPMKPQYLQGEMGTSPSGPDPAGQYPLEHGYPSQPPSGTPLAPSGPADMPRTIDKSLPKPPQQVIPVDVVPPQAPPHPRDPYSGELRSGWSPQYPPGPAGMAYGSFWKDFLSKNLPTALEGLGAGGLGGRALSEAPAEVVAAANRLGLSPETSSLGAHPQLSGAVGESALARRGPNAYAKLRGATDPASGRIDPRMAGTRGLPEPPEIDFGAAARVLGHVDVATAAQAIPNYSPAMIRELKSTMSLPEWRNASAAMIARMHPGDYGAMSQTAKDLLFGRGTVPRRLADDAHTVHSWVTNEGASTFERGGSLGPQAQGEAREVNPFTGAGAEGPQLPSPALSSGAPPEAARAPRLRIPSRVEPPLTPGARQAWEGADQDRYMEALRRIRAGSR